MTDRTLSRVQRFGSNARKAWLWVRCKENSFASWITSKGLPSPIAKLFVLLFNIALIAALVYLAIWAVIIIVIAFILISSLLNPDVMKNTTIQDDQGIKYKHGAAGFGLYSSDGYRVDNHDPNRPEP